MVKDLPHLKSDKISKKSMKLPIKKNLKHATETSTVRLFLDERKPSLFTCMNIFRFNDMKRVLKFVSFEFAAQQIYFLILPLLLFSVTVVVIQK